MSSPLVNIPPLFAVLVGIGKYENFEPLVSAADDAHKIFTFLTTKLGVPSKNITTLYDSDATKANILDAISSLPQKPNFNRNDAILFFFSGYAGQAKLESDEYDKEATVGMICPADIHQQSGIADKTLVQLFDQMSKSCGNNIVSNDNSKRLETEAFRAGLDRSSGLRVRPLYVGLSAFLRRRRT